MRLILEIRVNINSTIVDLTTTEKLSLNFQCKASVNTSLVNVNSQQLATEHAGRMLAVQQYNM